MELAACFFCCCGLKRVLAAGLERGPYYDLLDIYRRTVLAGGYFGAATGSRWLSVLLAESWKRMRAKKRWRCRHWRLNVDWRPLRSLLWAPSEFVAAPSSSWLSSLATSLSSSLGLALSNGVLRSPFSSLSFASESPSGIGPGTSAEAGGALLEPDANMRDASSAWFPSSHQMRRCSMSEQPSTASERKLIFTSQLNWLPFLCKLERDSNLQQAGFERLQLFPLRRALATKAQGRAFRAKSRLSAAPARLRRPHKRIRERKHSRYSGSSSHP